LKNSRIEDADGSGGAKKKMLIKNRCWSGGSEDSIIVRSRGSTSAFIHFLLTLQGKLVLQRSAEFGVDLRFSKYWRLYRKE
jgi:hypothetical protein